MSIQKLFPLPSGDVDYDVFIGYSGCLEYFIHAPCIERDERGNAVTTKNSVDVEPCVGGTSFNMAVALKTTFERKAFLAYSIGSSDNKMDGARDIVINRITDMGLDSHPLPFRKATSIAFVVAEHSREPVIYSYKPGSRKLATDKARDLVRNNDPSVIIMSGIMPEEVEMAEAAFAARPEAIKILNPRPELIAERTLFTRLCRMNPLLFINHQELGLYRGQRIPEDGVHQDQLDLLHDQLGTDKIIVTCNECGAVFSAREDRLWYSVPIRRFGRPVDKTGAGDAFLSGVVAAILEDVSTLEEMMHWGATMAGLKVRRVGGASVPEPREFQEAL